MAKLLSSSDLPKVSYCFATFTTGERIEYHLVVREVKFMRGAAGTAVVPMVKIRRRGDLLDNGSWYPMNGLTYVMPNGDLFR
jgi:hypothetical protein